jgi:hypothetical protein
MIHCANRQLGNKICGTVSDGKYIRIQISHEINSANFSKLAQLESKCTTVENYALKTGDIVKIF